MVGMNARRSWAGNLVHGENRSRHVEGSIFPQDLGKPESEIFYWYAFRSYTVTLVTF